MIGRGSESVRNRWRKTNRSLGSVTDRVVREKLARIRGGAEPRTLDVFAGCGGLSLGFKAAGFQIDGAIEICPTAAATYGKNLHPGDPRRAAARDVTAAGADKLVQALNLGKVGEAFDVVVGGPPCQAYARVGRPKLRELADDPEAFRRDGRAALYQNFVECVRVCKPIAVLMENVPDAMNFGGRNVAERVCRELRVLGYASRYTLLNAAFYGVPQMRERLFLIAYHQDALDQVSFPGPTHWIDLPVGYEGSRRVAQKVLAARDMCRERTGYVEPPTAKPSLRAAVTAEEAIGDLPALNARELVRKGVLKRGTRRFDSLAEYNSTGTVSAFSRSMREWVGFESKAGVLDHVIRFLPRDYALFARMEEGDQYPEAREVAERLLEERLSEMGKHGCEIAFGSDEYDRLRRATVPPYDPHKFPNKWRKMWRHQPARTVMAHLGKDGYSHIHYDSEQARTISVREAARLQSFPDGFQFAGAMNAAFRQIGNAVPPLMARSIATEMMKAMRGETL